MHKSLKQPIEHPCFFSFVKMSLYALLSYIALTATLLASSLQMDGGKIDIVFDPQPTENGEYRGIIDVQLKQGWKTYWQDPGNSGFAPQVVMDDGQVAQIYFPAPQRFTDGAEIVNGYKNHVVLPFMTAPLNGKSLVGSLQIGICQELCLPVNLDFDLKLPLENNFIAHAVVKAGFDKLPVSQTDSFKVERFERCSQQLEILALVPADADHIDLFIDGHGKIQFGKTQLLSRSDNQVRFMVDILYDQGQDQRVDYVLTADNQAVTGTMALEK